MEVRIGTNEGLFRLTAAGVAPVSELATTETLALAGEWAVTEGDEIVSIDRGVRVTAPVWPACIAPLGDAALVGTGEAHVFRLDASGALDRVTSFDEIEGRDGWYTPWGEPAATRSLTVTADGVPLVNVHVGGVWRGDADCSTWTEVVEVEDDTHQVLAARTGTRVIVAAAVGFGWSDDGGRTFRWTTDGLHDTYSRAVAFTGGHVLVSASDGPFTKRGAVYRRPVDAAVAFERCTNGLPESFGFNIDTLQMAGLDDQAVIGTSDGRVFRSADAGASWELAADDLPPVRCVAFA